MSHDRHTAKIALRTMRKHMPSPQTVAAAAAAAGNPAPLLSMDASMSESRPTTALAEQRSALAA